MTSTEEKRLHEILARFGADSLGDGDPVLGANTLAAMALVLANVAPADGRLVSENGAPLRLGVSLVVSGTASAGRVTDEVLGEIALRQNNLTSHLRRYAERIEERDRKTGSTSLPTGPNGNVPEDRFTQLQGGDEPLGESREECSELMLAAAPTESVYGLMNRPKILVTATGPEDLGKQLAGIRPGRPLVHLGLRRPSDLAEFAGPGGALIEGRHPVGQKGETVRGNLLITDSLGMLAEAVKAPDERTAWLGQFLWLTDGGAGPALPGGVLGTDAALGDEIGNRFRRSLGRLLGMRLNGPRKGTVNVGWDLGEARGRWTTFLGEMEPRLPGISFAARNLLASLFFGLAAIDHILWYTPRGQSELPVAGVEAFARYLVLRMANARAAMLGDGEAARRRLRIERVFRFLDRGPMDCRTIYRNLSLPASVCGDCLAWLEDEGLVDRDGPKWGRVDGARLNFPADETPLLEA